MASVLLLVAVILAAFFWTIFNDDAEPPMPAVASEALAGKSLR